MGSYIYAGLCTKVSFSQKDTAEVKTIFSTIDEFKRAIEQGTNLSMQYFDGQEMEDSYSFTLKSELLEPVGLLEFLNDFLSYLHQGDQRGFEHYHNELLEKVKNSHSAHEIFESANNEDDFSIDSYRFSESMYVTGSKRLYIQCYQIDCIPLFHHGKTSMESTEPLFSYIERLIRHKHRQPQASLIKLFLE